MVQPQALIPPPFFFFFFFVLNIGIYIGIRAAVQCLVWPIRFCFYFYEVMSCVWFESRVLL